jgi:hypothetical protein
MGAYLSTQLRLSQGADGNWRLGCSDPAANEAALFRLYEALVAVTVDDAAGGDVATRVLLETMFTQPLIFFSTAVSTRRLWRT